MSDNPETPIEPRPPLAILYQDDRYIAIDKPSGLLVHRTPLDTQETEYALQILRDQIGHEVHPCHRLDKATSGILVFALDKEALAELGKAFEEGRISKTYEAIVRGWPKDEGVIDRPLRRVDPKTNKRKEGTEQDAVTRFRTLRRSEQPYPTDRYATTRYALMELFPETGRQHQLRRHLDSINHPIVGDTRHGDNTMNRLFRERHGFLRLYLAATRLAFDHPFEKRRIEIEAALAPDFIQGLEAAGLSTV